MSNKDTFEAFIRIVQDKINDLSDGGAQEGMDSIKGEIKDRFDGLVISQGYVAKEEYEALEAIANRLESRLSELESEMKKIRAK